MSSLRACDSFPWFPRSRARFGAGLGLEGPATATDCAAVVGLSPSACSYHLRTLAQYGFVEEDLSSAADGRQRPWRARIAAFSIPDGPAVGRATRLAGEVLDEVVRAQGEELRERYRERQEEYPPDWREVLGRVTDVLHVTPDELAGLRTRLIALFGEYRRLDRGSRPNGARGVQVVTDLIAWFPPPPAAGARDADRPGESLLGPFLFPAPLSLSRSRSRRIR